MGCARCHDPKNFIRFPPPGLLFTCRIFKSTHTMDNHKVVAQWQRLGNWHSRFRAKRELVDKEVKKQKQAIESLKSKSAKSVIAQAPVMQGLFYRCFGKV
ncbi:MAG: hypothetical protein CM1200mP29_11680 [Verrucomicrobiota bacterium]|nr:MAG: hypothetical protein CM1200mP29_11680 [Verrucomicrobiota bacterium]